MVEESRKRSRDEALAAIGSSLRALNALIPLYDHGDFDIARDMATIIYRMVTAEMTVAAIRKSLQFLDYAMPPNSKNVLFHAGASLFRVMVQAEPEGPPLFTVTHIPALDSVPAEYQLPNAKLFGAWWNDPVIIAGAVDGASIPTDAMRHVPFEKRARLSRFEIVSAFRNVSGAHYDFQVNAKASFIDDYVIKGLDVVFDRGGEVYSIMKMPDRVINKNTRGQAIIRHVAFEIQESQKAWPL